MYINVFMFSSPDCEHEYWVLGHFTHYHPELNATIGHEIQVSLENNEKIFGQPSSEELLKMFCSLKNMDFRYQEVIILRGIVLFSRGNFLKHTIDRV